MTTRPYEVHLDLFEGPLDLLLYLVKKNDLEIVDIPISEITREYLSYLELLRELNLEVAGEFLVMASTLMQIKARSLLPPSPDEEEEGPDPRSELAQKLLEYQKFKGAASYLNERAEAFKDVHYRGAPRFRPEEKTLDASLFDLLEAVKDALHRLPEPRGMPVEEFPIERKMEKILSLLEAEPRLPLARVFSDERRRGGVLACFLALLELIKLRKVVARQEEAFGPVYLFARKAEEAALEGAEPEAAATGTAPEGVPLEPTESQEETA